MTERQLFRQSFDDAAIGMSILTVEPLGQYIEVNPAFCRMTGYSREELLARDFQSITASQDLNKNLELLQTLLTGAAPSLQIEKRYIRKDKSSFWACLHISLIRDLQNSPLYLLVQIEDIDEHKKAELLKDGQNQVLELLATGAALSEVLTVLVQTIEEQSPGMLCSVLLLDEDGKHLRHGAALSLPEEYNQAVDGIEIGPRVGSCGTAAFLGETVIVEDIETDPLWKDCRELALKHGLRACWSHPILSMNGQVLGTFAMYYRERRKPSGQDMRLLKAAAHIAGIAIEHKRAEETLKTHALVLESMAEGVNLSDDNGIIFFTNPAFDEMFSYKRGELLGKHVSVLNAYPPDENTRIVAEIIEHLKSSKAWFGEFSNRKKDGTQFITRARISPMEVSGRTFWISVQENVTERKRLEEQLRHAQKLEAIGQLAGGVAHEFNNLLTAIIGNLSMAAKQAEPETDLHSFLARSEQAAHRAAVLTKQLLTFSRREALDLKPQDLDPIVREVVSLLRQTIDRRIQIIVESEGRLWPILADADQMHLVVMNLCTNARDALMERLEKGPDAKTPSDWQPTIVVRTENLRVDEEYGRILPDAKPGDYVCLSISDNGCGIDEDVQHRIFEPFFTTKEVGRGAGLGLATVYGIVKQHGGSIQVSSAKNEITTFRVYLPKTDRPVAQAIRKDHEEGVAGGHETVLFVDDEAHIRRLGQTILERHGYTVLLAKDGVEALEAYNRERKRIRLVVLDLTMPLQSGAEVLKQLLRINPKLKVIISSGHRKVSDAENLQTLGAVEFVPKPYRPDELARQVRRLLDQP
jgi:PAS domain S-box-containing protein